MKKIDKYIFYIPIVYALYLPINFYIHIFEAYTGTLLPIVMNILDLLRVLVIAAFSYYLVKSYVVLEFEKTNEYGLIKEWEKLPKSKFRPFNRIEINGNKIYKTAIDNQGIELGRREINWYK